MTKYSYSLNEEQYHGPCDSLAEAIAEASGHSEFWVGENRPPTPAEECWDIDDWLERVACHEDYDAEWVDGWDHFTKEERQELEKEVRKVLGEWLNRRDRRPNFWLVENVRHFRVDENGKPEEVKP
jgi:hypothetical protein